MKTTRDKLLSCTLKRVRVKLPEYGLDLDIQEMTAGQREEYYSILTTAMTDKKQKKNVAARILLPSLLDLDGQPLLTDDDLERLVNLSPQVVTILTNSLLEVSGLLPEFYESEKKRLSRQKAMSFFSGWRRSLARALQR
jgi:hypothetical protein